MSGIGSDARGFLYHQEAVVSEALVPFGQARPFQGGCDRSGALSEATNGDADGVVMNPACQLAKFFDAQPAADSADEKSGLACAGAASR
jgi:hypothetical protein